MSCCPSPSPSAVIIFTHPPISQVHFHTSTKLSNIIKTGTCRPMTKIKSTLLPQGGTLSGVLLLLSVLPLKYAKSDTTILIAPAPGLLKN